MKSHRWHLQEMEDRKEQQRLIEQQIKLEKNILGHVVTSIPSQNPLPAPSFPYNPITFSSISESPELTYENQIKRKVKALRTVFFCVTNS